MTAPPAPAEPAEPVAARLLEANLETAEAIAALLRERPGAAATPIPGATWTVGEAAAHLVLANRLMAELADGLDRPYGDGTPGSLAAANEESLAAYPERDPLVLGAELVRHARAFADACAGRPADQPARTPLGPMDLGTLASYLLTHQLGHGWDLARALRRPHMVSRERVELSLPFLLLAMPRVVDPARAAGLRATFAVGLRGGPRYGVSFDGGAVAVSHRAPERPDCTIVCEHLTFFLLALGRRTPAQALARAGTFAWGRRPWLAPRFPTYFAAP
ncbi:sterol-binding protein [Kitasatospora sp. MMS16-BH015]|uniref:maleylpyruvate isomerase family mycothiol-dependent enzyme n=1 Tax=Kitasatospora sp. MMS16-BH015 TaxID=2018025 RepID=UPI000CA13720|nr:maleylpyruvate isomerase family mycothiol-dependent enzyme [Kitasatospora sp. MMS16-BH015]AUG76322.1 sterol-binding protein [Kitasatospora sp. MMS16-BH015]